MICYNILEKGLYALSRVAKRHRSAYFIGKIC